MVSEETVVGEFGFSSLLLCEVDLEAAVASEDMEMVQVSQLLSLITIMVAMYYFRLLMVTALLSINQQLHLTVTLMLYKQLLLLLVLKFKLLVIQQVFQDNRSSMLFRQVTLQQLLSQHLAAAMLKVQLLLRVTKIELLPQSRQLYLQERLMLRLILSMISSVHSK